MTTQEKYKMAFRLTAVASSGLDFIEESLRQVMNNSTDLAYLRSFYLLLSYNCELLLKSRVAMLGNFSNTAELKDTLQKFGHDLMSLSRELGDTKLNIIGIRSISKIKGKYKISTIDNKEVYIENFTDVRYDFLDGVMRSVDSKEHERLKEDTGILLLILKKVKENNEKEKNA